MCGKEREGTEWKQVLKGFQGDREDTQMMGGKKLKKGMKLLTDTTPTKSMVFFILKNSMT